MSDYTAFFRAATRCAPYPYQLRLAQSWPLPSLVAIAPGLGRTSGIVLSWLWRISSGGQVPRRLFYCLPMHAPLEPTRALCQRWVANLCAAGYFHGQEPMVAVLEGGESSLGWDVYPEIPTIVIGTQERVLSRAVNRGYALRRRRWAVHFGLLNNDCLWVLDEKVFFGAGATTALQLNRLRAELGHYGDCGCVVVDGISALEAGNAFTLAPEDWAGQGPVSLPGRMLRHRGIEPARTVCAPADVCGYASSLAAEVLEAHRSAGAHGGANCTLVVVNSDERCRAIYRELDRSCHATARPEIALLHVRYRPDDAVRAFGRLTGEPPAAGRIVVATSCIEVGVAVNADVLFSELASWPAMVRRLSLLSDPSGSRPLRAFWIDGAADSGSTFVNGAGEALAPRQLLASLPDASTRRLAEIGYRAPAPVPAPLAASDMVTLFDHAPDAAVSASDVASLVSGSRDIDVYPYWRSWGEGDVPGAGLWPPAEGELCPVPSTVFRRWVASQPAGTVWCRELRRGLEARWRPLAGEAEVRGGATYLVRAQRGGYSPEAGWSPEDVVSAVASALPAQQQRAGYWQSLAGHTDMVVRELAGMLAALSLGDLPSYDLLRAARWHDAGKAHDVVQEYLQSRGGAVLAKSPRRGVLRRKHFRHDLASALCALQNGESDLAAYLAAAHHGGVRATVRHVAAVLEEGAGGALCLGGICHGDVISSTELGGGVVLPQTVLDLSALKGDGAQWVARVALLLDALGPFRLAYLEALVKAADERASSKGAESEFPT